MTLEKAVDNNELTYNIAGKTTLKKTTDKDEDKKVLQVSENELYKIGKCKLTRLIGYIPVENGQFVEYRKFNFLILLLFGLGLTALATLIFNWNRWFSLPDTPDTPSQGGIGYDVGQTDKPKDPSAPTETPIQFPSITMPGYDKFVIKADTTKVDTISLFNPSQNEGWYDLAFTIVADINNDGEFETLYESAKVAPGYRINEFEINQALSAGTYNAKILIHPYYVENETAVLNNGAISIPLVVQ